MSGTYRKSYFWGGESEGRIIENANKIDKNLQLKVRKNSTKRSSVIILNYYSNRSRISTKCFSIFIKLAS